MSEDLLNLRPTLIRIEELKEHEQHDPKHLEELLQDIKSCGVLRRPVIADAKTKVILDGHHRYNSLKRLGCRYIPVYLVDYFRPEIVVLSWNDDKPLAKEVVIEAGLSGRLLPPRSSRHMVKIGGELHHITYIERESPTRIDDLK